MSDPADGSGESDSRPISATLNFRKGLFGASAPALKVPYNNITEESFVDEIPKKNGQSESLDAGCTTVEDCNETAIEEGHSISYGDHDNTVDAGHSTSRDDHDKTVDAGHSTSRDDIDNTVDAGCTAGDRLNAVPSVEKSFHDDANESSLQDEIQKNENLNEKSITGAEDHGSEVEPAHKSGDADISDNTASVVDEANKSGGVDIADSTASAVDEAMDVSEAEPIEAGDSVVAVNLAESMGSESADDADMKEDKQAEPQPSVMESDELIVSDDTVANGDVASTGSNGGALPIVEEPQGEKEESDSDTMVEEPCTKKIISMDTDGDVEMTVADEENDNNATEASQMDVAETGDNEALVSDVVGGPSESTNEEAPNEPPAVETIDNEDVEEMVEPEISPRARRSVQNTPKAIKTPSSGGEEEENTSMTSRRRGRSSRINNDEMSENADAAEKTPSRGSRAQRTPKAVEVKDDHTKETNNEVAKTPSLRARTPRTPKTTEHKEGDGKHGEAQNVAKTPSLRGRTPRTPKTADIKEDNDTEEEAKTPSLRGRRPRTPKTAEIEEEEQVAKTPKRAGRTPRTPKTVAVEESTKSKHTTLRSAKSEASVSRTSMRNKTQKVTATPEPTKTPRNARSAKRTNSSSSDVDTSSRRSTRTAKTSQSAEESPLRSPRSDKCSKAVNNKTNREEAQTPQRTAKNGSAVTSPTSSITRSSRRNAVGSKGTPTAAKTTPKSAKKTPRTPKEEEFDPYDMETEMEVHPEPLKNITMEVQSFGEVKYARVGSGRYEQTEKVAESRVGNLVEMRGKSSNARQSLGDLTPGKKKRPTSSKRPDREDDEQVEKSAKKAAPTPSRSARKRKTSSTVTPSSAKRAHKEDVRVPVLDAEAQWAVDHSSDETPHEAGARVYAAYDKTFYPAIVSDRDGLGRFQVLFVEDNVLKNVPPAGVIPLRALVADRECIYEQRNMKVVKSPNAASADPWLEGVYELVELNEDGDPTGDVVSATWDKLELTLDDWREYVKKKSKEATEIVQDNISSGSERHSRHAKAQGTVSAAISAQNTPRTPKAKTPRATPQSAAKPQSDAKQSPSEARTTPSVPKKKGRPMKNPDPPVLTAEEEMPEETPKALPLFSGMIFILTSAQRQADMTSPNSFKKKMMSDFIESADGMVVEDFAAVDKHPDRNAYLISDTHYRTHKYLSAMARAVPCVKHEWIIKCRDEGSLVPYEEYLLPAGVSIVDQKTYPLPKERVELLKDKLVLVHSTSRPTTTKSLTFTQIWEPMVRLLGGNVVTELPDEGVIDIILTDSSATVEVIARAEQDDAVVVSSEWLIQAIIMSGLPDPKANNRFRHDAGGPKAVAAPVAAAQPNASSADDSTSRANAVPSN